MSESFFETTTEEIIDSDLDLDLDSDLDLDLEYRYDCWQNESYDSDFYISCAMTMIIFIYINLIDYIAKKYIH